MAIQVSNLTKKYAQREVVSDVSLEVRAGEVFALLGRNGAGKTTTVEMIEGYRRPTSGKIRVLGLDPITDARRMKGSMGVMLQEQGLNPALRVGETVRLFSSLYTHPLPSDETIAIAGLEAEIRTPIRRLSSGQKQRLSLALSMVGRPSVLFLDEPTAWMDVQARESAWQLIREMATGGTAVFLTTHAMQEAARADRVAVLDEGRIVAGGDPNELRRTSSGITIRVDREFDAHSLSKRLGGSHVSPTGADQYTIDAVPTPQVILLIAQFLEENGVAMTELTAGRSLEAWFLELTSPDLRPSA